MTTSNILLETSMGKIRLELYTHHAPKTCHHFESLVRNGFYDNMPWQYILPGDSLQTGDLSGTGLDSATTRCHRPPGEIYPAQKLRHTGAGVLSMAKASPDTSSTGSKFFITLGPAHKHDGERIVIGRVENGMEVVRMLSMAETDRENKPVGNLMLERASVIEEAEI